MQISGFSVDSPARPLCNPRDCKACRILIHHEPKGFLLGFHGKLTQTKEKKRPHPPQNSRKGWEIFHPPGSPPTHPGYIHPSRCRTKLWRNHIYSRKYGSNLRYPGTLPRRFLGFPSGGFRGHQPPKGHFLGPFLWGYIYVGVKPTYWKKWEYGNTGIRIGKFKGVELYSSKPWILPGWWVLTRSNPSRRIEVMGVYRPPPHISYFI